MGQLVIVAYRPRPGREEELLAVVRRHVSVLVAEGLATNRAAYVGRAADGTVVEVFEWRSADAIRRAHESRAVQALWADFGAVCDYVPLAELAETRQPFATFEALA